MPSSCRCGRWPAGNQTAARKQSLSALIALGLGAGFGGTDVRLVRRRNITHLDGAVFAKVDSDPRQRTTPLLTVWNETLLDAVQISATTRS